MESVGTKELSDATQQLQNSLERGLGSAFRLAPEMAPETVVELIIKTARNHALKAENDARSAWLVALADFVGSQAALCRELLLEVDKSQDCNAVVANLNLIFHFARRGSEPARDALYRTFVRQQFADASIGGFQIIDLDRYDGFLFAAEVLGQRLSRELDYEASGALFKHAARLLDIKQVEKRLTRRAERSPQVGLYRENLIQLGLVSDDGSTPMVPIEQRSRRTEARALADRAEGAAIIPGARALALRGLSADNPGELAKSLPSEFSSDEGDQLASALVYVARESPFPEFGNALSWAAQSTRVGETRREALSYLCAWNQLPPGLLADCLSDASKPVRTLARQHLVPSPGLELSANYHRSDDPGGRFFEFQTYRMDAGVAALWNHAEVLENLLALGSTAPDGEADHEEKGEGDAPVDSPFAAGPLELEALDFAPRKMIQLRLQLGEVFEDASLPRMKVTDVVEAIDAASGYSNEAVAYRLVRPLPVEAAADFLAFQDMVVIDRKGGRVGRLRFGAKYPDF